MQRRRCGIGTKPLTTEKKKKKKANRSGNQNWKTTDANKKKDLGDVMMKLD